MKLMAGAATLGEVASAVGVRAEEALIAELKAGSEEAYAWLIDQYHQQIYGLVYRLVNDPADAADTTQEVFLKVFRGMKRFHGESSLKTWMYRIAVHEASNRRRWWFRHKAQETSIEPVPGGQAENNTGLKDTLADAGDSPFDSVAHRELRARVDTEVRHVPEPYRTTVILRDLEGLAYEEIAEVMQVSLGTVKSRLMRGREALKKRLEAHLREFASELGLQVPEAQKGAAQVARGQEVEVR